MGARALYPRRRRHRLTNGNRQRKPERRVFVAIFVVAFLVRLAPAGLYVTPDEPIWVHRSIQFLDALTAWDWDRAPQTGHPGVTTMALGAIGIKVTQLLRPSAAAAHLDWLTRLAWLAPENAAAFEHLGFFLPAGRLMVITLTSLGLVAAYALGRSRLGERAARWLALLLALDPFLAGHSGLLHTDALQATFVLLAVLLALPRRDLSRSRSALRWLAVAGCLALAGLTKTLGLLVAPGLALALLLWGKGNWGRRVGRVAAVALLSLGLLLIMTPTFMRAPRAALEVLVQAVAYHEGIGLRDVFFAGAMRTDPGPAFYPVVLAFRLTPPVLLGVLVFVFKRRSLRTRWAVVGAAGLPALGYILALTVATKKFDRYILSALPLLALIAALSLSQMRRPWRHAAVASLLLPWAAVAILPLHYATPLLGGPRIAQRVVPLGWGEVAGLAAGRLNAHLSDPERASLLTTNVPGAAARFEGTVRAYDDRLVGCADVIIGTVGESFPGYTALDQLTVGGRHLTTLFVTTSAASGAASLALDGDQLVAPGRLPGLPDEAIAPITTTDGLTAWLNDRFAPDLPFLRLHAPACYPLSDAHLDRLLDGAQEAGQVVCQSDTPVLGFRASRCELRTALTPPAAPARFAGALDLVTATWASPVDRAEPLTVRLRLYPRVALGEVEVYLALQTGEGSRTITWAEGGQRLVNDWTWPAPQWPVGQVADARAYIEIPRDLPPGSYNLVMMLSGAEGWLSLTRETGRFGGIVLPLGIVEVPSMGGATFSSSLLPVVDPGWPGLKIWGIAPPAEQIEAGRALDVAVGVERSPGNPPRALSWSLICDGVVRQIERLPWAPSSPDAWGIGERYTVAFALPLDADLPEAACTVVMQPAEASGEALVIGETSIIQRERQFALSRPPKRALSVGVGDYAELIGSDVAETIRPGEPLTVTLYWRALGAAMVDDTAFVHLADDAGRIWAQSDQYPAGGAAPTVTWVAGEIIVDHHRLIVPPDLPPGAAYTLYAGLYDALHGAREPVMIGTQWLDEGRVEVGEVTLRP